MPVEHLLTDLEIQSIMQFFADNPNENKIQKNKTQIVIKGKPQTLTYSVIKDTNGNVFVLEKILGEGSYGKVKLGKNIKTGELVAIKIQHPDRGEDVGNFIRELNREETIMAQMNQFIGNLDRKIQLFRTINTQKHYTIMPLIKGTDLDKLLEKVLTAASIATTLSDTISSTTSKSSSNRTSSDATSSADPIGTVIRHDSIPDATSSADPTDTMVIHDSIPDATSLADPIGSVVIHDSISGSASESTVVKHHSLQNNGCGNIGALFPNRSNDNSTQIREIDPPIVSLTKLSAVIKLIKNIAQKVKTCHDNGILHLDLKPGNIMVFPTTLDATLLDFGVSLILPEGQTTITDSKVRGTPTYLAPEINKAYITEQSNIEYSPKTDIASLGKIFLELLHGLILYEAAFKPQYFKNSGRDPKTEILNKLTTLCERMIDIAIDKRPNMDTILKEIEQIEQILFKEQAKTLFQARSSSSTLQDALVRLRQSQSTALTRNNVLPLLVQCGPASEYRQRMAAITDAKLQSVNNSYAKKSLEVLGDPSTAFTIEKEEDFSPIEVAKTKGFQPGLEALKKQNGFQCSKQAVLQFAQECVQLRLVDYRTAVSTINRSF